MSDSQRDSTTPAAPEERKIEAARRAVASVEATRERGVLVVEDDPDLQWRIARMLTVRGNRVVGTSSGEAALELMSQWPVDLVLVDETLPGMSGVELARAIRERHGPIPVVLMSAEDSREARLAARLAGAAAVLAKPFGIDALLDLLRSLPGYEAELVPAE
ncbi:MAG: response regulator [Sandaracinaceae bacterium]|nr:response regulator [Sandaracinaceae bacterium]